MKLFDVVVLTRDLPDHGLPANGTGTIVHEHADGSFEVEFCDGDGRTIALLAVCAEDLRISLAERDAVPRPRSPSSLRRSPKHCPVCAAALEKNAKRTRLMNACEACRARPSPDKRCRRCAGDRIWENKSDAGCRRCGLHGPKGDVIAVAGP